MSKVSMTARQIKDLGLWDKVCEYTGINPWAFNEGQITDDEIIEFDSEFKKPKKELPNTFTDECFILRNEDGMFCYGECSGCGYYFEDAYKWNDEEDVSRFINHNREYDNSEWKPLRVKINYEIVE